MAERVIRRILAPVLLSDPEVPDMTYAMRVAAQLDAELIFCSVIDRVAMVNLIGRHKASALPPGEGFRAALVQDAEAILQDLVDRAGALGVTAFGHATVGEDVVERILKEALVQKVDLILVRSHARHGLMRALLGDTAEEILKASPCPVLLAPGS